MGLSGMSHCVGNEPKVRWSKLCLHEEMRKIWQLGMTKAIWISSILMKIFARKDKNLNRNTSRQFPGRPHPVSPTYSEHWRVSIFSSYQILSIEEFQFFNFLASLFSIFQILSMDKTFNFAPFLSILWESKNFSLVKFSLFEKLLINSLYRACWSFLLFFFLFCFVDHSSVF